MKKVLILLTCLFSILFANAQDAILTSSKGWSVVGSSALVATTALNASVNYTAYVNTFSEGVKYELKTTNNSGTSLAKAVLYESFDYSTWTKVDSVICTGNNTQTKSTYTAVYAPYLKWTITAYTNAQSTNWKLFILVKRAD